MTVVQWVLFGAWEIWGVAVWLGVYRGWRRRGPEARFLCLLMPWLACALVFLVLVPELSTALGVKSMPDAVAWLVAGAASVCLSIGFWAGITESPRWALPPWLRVVPDTSAVAEPTTRPTRVDSLRQIEYREPTLPRVFP